MAYNVEPPKKWSLKVGCFDSKQKKLKTNILLMEEIPHHPGWSKPYE